MKNNIGLLLAKRAHLSPGLEAVYDVATERRFDYAEANRRCNRTANALAAAGVGRGDRVGLLLMNSMEFFESFLAIAKICAICVPLNWRLVAEVENVIRSHEGVGDVGVIGQPSKKWGEAAVAVIVRADPALQAQDVLDHCHGELARFKQPVAVEFVDEIPRNPSGKILKRILREKFPGPAAE